MLGKSLVIAAGLPPAVLILIDGYRYAQPILHTTHCTLVSGYSWFDTSPRTA